MKADSTLLGDKPAARKGGQQQSSLAPHRRGKGKQELYWLVEGEWAVSPRILYYDKKGEEISRVVELFKAKPDVRYGCGFSFTFSHTASSLEGLKDVCWHLVAQSPRLMDAGQALAGFTFEGQSPIDLSYVAEVWGNLKEVV